MRTIANPLVNQTDRRRFPRVRTAPRRVQVAPECEGVLLNLSERGAMVQLDADQGQRKTLVVHLEWSRQKTLYIRSRIVWSSTRPVEGLSAKSAGSAYLVGLEFRDLRDDTLRFLRAQTASG